MNALYIVIPFVVLLCVAIILIKPPKLLLNSLNGKNIKDKYNKFKWGIPIFDKRKMKIVEHPPIANSGLN